MKISGWKSKLLKCAEMLQAFNIIFTELVSLLTQAFEKTLTKL